MAGLHFDITGDNSNLLRKLQETENGVKSVSRTVEKEGGNIEALFNRITKSAAVFGAGFTAKEFVTQVAQVRGEFQKLEVAFTTMLGSKQKAEELMAQMIRTAATTPFSLQDVAGGAKQLLAYGVAAEDVNQTLIRLGDIAAGLSIPLGDLVYLYGTTRAQGRLYTEDFNQFTSRGIPMIAELSKMFGVAESEVKGLVEAGKVGFPEVQKVIENLTNEGGKFGGLMEAQSKTIAGQISNIEDSISQMFNEIGQANEGIISDALSGVSSLVENYEKVGTVIIGLVGIYGTYKVAVMTVTALQSLQATGISVLTTKEIIHYGWLVATQKAQMLLNATMLANPYVAVAVAVAGVAAAIWTLSDRTSAAEKATKNFNQILDENAKKQEEHKKKIDELTATIENNVLSEGERLAAFEKLKAEYPAIFDKYLTETEYLKEIVKYKKLIAEEDAKRTNADDREALRLAELKLQEYRNRKAQGVTMIDMNGNGWGDTNVNDAINAQLAIVNQAKAKVAEPEVNSFLSKIKELKDSDIASVIDDIDLSLKALENSGNNAIAIVSSLGGEFSKGQLDMIKSALASEQKAREKGNGNYQEDYDAAKKAWEDAKKKLQEIEVDKKKFTAKQYTDAKADYADKKKKFESLGGITSDKSIKDSQKEIDEQKKQQQQLYDELLQLRRANQQNEINLLKEGSEKKRRQIELDYQKEIDAYNKAKAKYGETDEVKQMKTNAEEKRKQSIYNVDLEQLQSEKDALNSYLQEYGTFQQRKYAIAQEYTDKIAKAQTDAERMRLGKERDSKLSGIESEALKANIDWATVFGEFGGMFSEMIKPALEDARKYMRTDEFKNSDAASQQAMIDAVNQMEKSLGNTGGLDFKKLGEDVQAYQYAVVSLNLAKEQEADALERLAKAQEDYENALRNGTDEQKNAAKEALENAQSNANATSANVQMQAENTEKAQKGMSDTATALKANMDNVVNGLQQITSGGLTNIYHGLIDAGKGIGGATGKLADSLESVPVVGWILSIIDIFKDGISVVISGLLDSVFSAVSGIIEDVLSGDLVVSIGESLMKGIGSIFDAISFGGFSKLTSIGSNAKEVQEAIDRLTDRNEALQGSINALNDTIKAGRGKISVDATEKAIKYQEEQNANYLKIAQEQARYSGSHHSWNYYWGGFSQSQINDFSNQIGRSWDGSLWNLSPEEMKLLKGNVEMWTQIQNTGKGGYGGRLTEKLDDYIEQAGKIEELNTELFEGLTNMTFDSMYDSFIDTLMDMDASAEDFADNMSEYFMRAMLSNKIGELYYDRLNEWYEDFATRMKDGTLDDNELEYLQGVYNGIVNEAIRDRDAIAAATGYDKIGEEAKEQQSASSKGFETMTQDQASELNGRFTALYEVGLQILQNISILQTISVSTDGCNATLLEIRNLMISSNGHLEDISGFVKKILEGFGEKLDNINTNIKNGLQ